MNSEQQDQQDEPAEDGKPGFFAIVASTLAAAFGIQSSKNRERDFKHGNIWVFVVAGIIFTAGFILILTTLVKVALSF